MAESSPPCRPAKTRCASTSTSFHAARLPATLGAELTEPWLAQWLPATYAVPERFASALYGYAQSKRGGSLKSQHGAAGRPLPRTCVVAHVRSRKPAIVAREDGQWRGSLLRVSARALVEPGGHVAALRRRSRVSACASSHASGYPSLVAVLTASPLGTRRLDGISPWVRTYASERASRHSHPTGLPRASR